MSQAKSILLEVKDLKKVYRTGEVETPALRGVDFSLQEGAFASVVGPILDGIRLDECPEKELSRIRLKHLGFVFQAYNLFPVLTAAENVEYVMMLQSVPAPERRRKALELLEAVGLKEMAHKRPTQLSGGEQQRVAVARAISTNPRLVLADEPTANLDSESAARLLDLMEKLNREHGVTFLFSTHDPRVVKRAHRVIHLRDGRVVDAPGDTSA